MESHETTEVGRLVEAAKAGDEDALRRLIAWSMDYLFPAVLAMLRERHAQGTYVTDVLHQSGPDMYERMQDDAWEITHSACVRMAGGLVSFRGRGAFGRPVQFSTWLYAIARNEMRTLLRNRWRERRRRHTGGGSSGAGGGSGGGSGGAGSGGAFGVHTGDLLEGAAAAAVTADLPGQAGSAPDQLFIDQWERDLLREALEKAPLTAEQKQAVIMFHGLGYPQERIAALTGVQVGTVKKRIFDGLRKLRAYMQERSAEPPKADGRDGRG